MDNGGTSRFLHDIDGFDWDEGNQEKNWKRHKVHAAECEEMFFNKSFLIHVDRMHSKTEQRFHALGQTDKKRRLFVAFTMRRNKIRVISARDQSDRERREYAKAESATTV